MVQAGFFTHEIQLHRLDRLGDSLKRIADVIDFEMFRTLLDQLLERKRDGLGRPPWDCVFMFRVLILQMVRGLSDERVEFELIDSASAQRFVCISPHDPVPDSRTIWLFREKLVVSKIRHSGEGCDQEDTEETNGAKLLFELFRDHLAEAGILCRDGKTVDATIVDVGVQRKFEATQRTKTEGKQRAMIQESPRKAAQTDSDARWTRKDGRSRFGYKNSIVGGISDGFIHDYLVAPANVHDSKIVPPRFFKPTGKSTAAYGDKAYIGREIGEKLHQAGIESRIHSKGGRGITVTDQQKQMNRINSKVRAKIEHRFARMRMCLGGMLIRSIGIKRCGAVIGFINLVYNMLEYSRVRAWPNLTEYHQSGN